MFLDDPGLPLIGFGFRDGMCPYVYGLGLGDCGELRARGRLKWRLGCRVMADKRGEAGGHESRPDGREVDMSFRADASDEEELETCLGDGPRRGLDGMLAMCIMYIAIIYFQSIPIKYYMAISTKHLITTTNFKLAIACATGGF